ncbi:MAG: hypothetical protein A3H70_00245 [Candidatus Komeilibacteria bacterium RIFCSPLOWO2_02_FULL_48_11]|uniref:DDH domain-containing protein n=1 Tax=Candidatus Komeilibacteria bacterium RIFCSPLOWO2_02_FULL_48_11 TaxID=1798553 RepID=A0A1G2BSS7_9BACT|nr:MAG: hypothetical protein A3H70_00245 [Candidatus Komeilibacteria bacterium RIFCSPLOWO2_02_FULL_48_11]
MNKAFPELQKFITANKQLAVVTHHRPDGDAIGALLALAAGLASLGKEVSCYCFDALPHYLTFLSGAEKIKSQVDDFWRQTLAIIIVDCGDLSMVGLPAEEFAPKRLAVVDHHISNPLYGEINVVESAAASTAEIIFNYFKFARLAVDKAAATALLTGVYTDTDGFSNLGTTPESLSIAAELLKLGANFKEITANTLQNKSIASLKLWGKALERLRLDRDKGIAVTVLRLSDIEECQAKAEDAEGIASLLNHLSDVKMSMVLREQADGTVKGSLRTANELIDVSKIAKLLGGGGHMKAAGFTVKGRVAETEKGWKIIE